MSGAGTKHRHHEAIIEAIRPSFARQIGADLKNPDHLRVYKRGHNRLEYLQQTGRLNVESYDSVVKRMQAAIVELDFEVGEGLKDMEKRAQRGWRNR